MAVLLDTSVILGLDSLDLGAYAGQTAVVSAVSIGELASGLGLSTPAVTEAREQRFRAVLERFEILRYGVEEAKLYGVLTTLVRAAGRNPRLCRLDLQIAATAAARQFPLLTCYPDDFIGADRLVNVVAVSPVPGGPDSSG